jgi:chaperonin GroEL (HSP60 family)
MFERGIIDPAEVVRIVQDAASIAGLLIRRKPASRSTEKGDPGGHAGIGMRGIT